MFGAAATTPIGGWTLVRNPGITGWSRLAGGSWAQGSLRMQLAAEHAVALAVVVAFGAVQLRLAGTVRYGRRGANRTRSASSRPEGLPVGLSRWNSTCRPGIDETPATLGELVQAGRPRRAVFLPPRCAPCQDLAGERQSANSSPTQQQHQPTPVTPDMVTRGLRRRKDNHDHQQGYGDDAD